MMKVYLIYDLMAECESNPGDALVAATLTEEAAREEVYRYLRDDAGLNQKDWESMVERTGCQNFEELAYEIRHGSRYDKDLNIKVEVIYPTEK